MEREHGYMARLMSTYQPQSQTQPHSTGDLQRGGFSLLEVMVALGILAVGVLGVTAGQVAAIKLSSTSRSHTLALYLADQQMEMLHGTTAADVKALITGPGFLDDPNNPIQQDPGGGAPIDFTRRWLIETDTPETGVIRMTVEVDFQNGLGVTRTARLQSLKADS